jgi:hypothetical protein
VYQTHEKRNDDQQWSNGKDSAISQNGGSVECAVTVPAPESLLQRTQAEKSHPRDYETEV